MGRLLVIEDDSSLGALVQVGLETVGHDVTQASTVQSARTHLAGGAFDLVILDIGLPDGDGSQVIPTIREKGIPVIIITARDSVSDTVRGLDAGADDYLSKPFEILELMARVRAVLRRSGRERKHIALPGIDIDLEARRVRRGGRPVELTRQEFDLLVCFAEHPDIALTRERLLSLAWGYEYAGATRTVDVHVQRLRDKLRIDAIHTVPGIGYRLET